MLESLLELLVQLAVIFFAVVQLLVWFAVAKQFAMDRPDREDVFALIPGAWVFLVVRDIARKIPQALRTPPEP